MSKDSRHLRRREPKLWLLAALAGLFWFLGPTMCANAADETLPTLLGARVTATAERARLILDLSAPPRYAIVSLSNPERIAIDVEVGAVKLGAPEPLAEKGLVTKFQTGMVAKGRARTELGIDGPVQILKVDIIDAIADQPARLIVDLVPDSEENFTRRVADDLAASLTRKARGEEAEKPVAEPIIKPPSTIARPLIILDPGHGGADSGAKSLGGIEEKNIVLAFALKLQALLVAMDRFDVALTRNSDVFLRLEDRVALARQNKADLFLSIHADTFQQPDIRGASIYARDESATDALDKVLAERENRADIVAGFVPSSAPEPVVDILVDLMRRETRRKAYIAAEAIVSAMQPNVRLRKFPVRRADFLVLQAPDVPSLLIELGFLSNDQDIANLVAEDWIDKVAESIAEGVAAYFDGVAQK